LDHHKKGPTPPFTTRQGPNAPINYQTRPIHDFAVSSYTIVNLIVKEL
jgi:hypothetical protein